MSTRKREKKLDEKTILKIEKAILMEKIRIIEMIKECSDLLDYNKVENWK